MKVLIFSLVALTFFANSAASAVDIQADFNQLINRTIDAKIAKLETELVLSLREKVDHAFHVVHVIYFDKLNELSSVNMALLEKYLKTVGDAIDGVNKTFASSLLKTNFNTLLTNIKAPVLVLVTAQKNQTQSALVKYPESSKCWDEFKVKFEEKYKLFADGFHMKDQEFMTFNTTVTAEIKVIEGYVNKYFEESRIECGDKYAKCFEDYVSLF